MTDLQENIKFMRIAINLAKKAVGTTFPNPPVGCVIVKNGRIISACNTQPQGKTHAEVSAINKANPEDLKGATMYVTMEPCSHFGKSPPCVNAVIPSGISNVFIANKDANPKVNGEGVKALRQAGIEVIEDFLHYEAMEINLPFFRSIAQHLPYVTLKMGASLDGKIALSNGKSKWVTSEYSRNYSQILRYRNDAILVGINTIKQDDSLLNLRLEGLEKYSPVRVIIDKNLETPIHSQIVKTAKNFRTIIFCSEKEFQNSRISELQNSGLEIIQSPDPQPPTPNIQISYILNSLAKIGISRLLVEGGAGIATSFLKENLIDEIHIINSGKVFGGDATSIFSNLELSEIPPENFSFKSQKFLGKDSLSTWRKI